MNLADCNALLTHSECADAILWKSVLALGQEDVELRTKLHHIHQTQWIYLQIWRGDPLQLPALDEFPKLGDIRDWARAYYREIPEYLATLTGTNLSRDVHFPWADRLIERFGKVEPAAWKDTLLQVVMHSTYHRGQVARRLRELGAEPPTTDYIAWIWLDRPPAAWD